MRKSDIVYNPPLPYVANDLKRVEDMSLEELNNRILKTCAKCHGDYTICEGCMGCDEGRMLIMKLKEEPKNKLSGILKMKNMSPVAKQEEAKKLYRDALLSGDPVEYLMKACEITEERAKSRLSVYKKKYRYIGDKLRTLRGMAEHVVMEPKKMVELVPKVEEKKEQTVTELVESMKDEKAKLMERIREIDNALKVIGNYEQVSRTKSAV